MDSLSQLVLGGSIAAAIGHKQLGRSALVIGGVLATLPDLDVFLPTKDVISSFTEHRSFSHSLFVLFPFSLVCFLLLRLKFKTEVISNQRLFWLCSLALITHPMLDSFTSYGTQLFWPLAGHPISIASIFAVDPLYTLPLLIGCVYLWRHGEVRGQESGTNKSRACDNVFRSNTASSHTANKSINIHYKIESNKIDKARRVNYIGLILSSGYLLLGFVLQGMMQKKVELVLLEQGIGVDKIFISPLYPSLNWWGAIVFDKGVYYDVNLNVLTNTLAISVKRDLGGDIIDFPIPALTSLNWFTNGFIRLENVNEQLIVTDLRMKTGGIGYAFKFVLAEKENQKWEPIQPYQL